MRPSKRRLAMRRLAMRRIATHAALALLLLAPWSLTACSEDDGNGGTNPNPTPTHAGTYEGTNNLSTGIAVSDITTSDPPLTDTCLGDIEVTVNLSANPQITGAGSCVTSANAATYTLTGNFDDDDDASGTITLVFSGKNHTVDWSGSFDAGTFTATFAGRTLQTTQIAIDWDGDFDAARP